MATEPQPTSQGILQNSRCLEREEGLWPGGHGTYRSKKYPKQQYPATQHKGVEEQANKHYRKLTDSQGQCDRRDVTCARASAGVLMYSL